jgi:hypothetical protein
MILFLSNCSYPFLASYIIILLTHEFFNKYTGSSDLINVYLKVMFKINNKKNIIGQIHYFVYGLDSISVFSNLKITGLKPSLQQTIATPGSFIQSL